MIIAISAVQYIPSTGNKYLYDYFLRLAATQKNHQFVFIGPANSDTIKSPEGNIHFIHSAPKGGSSLLWKYWLNYTLPALAKKHKAELLVHLGGLCSMRTKIAQCMVVSDLSFMGPLHFYSKTQAAFLKKNMAAFILKAGSIASASDFISQELEQHFETPIAKIKPLPFLLPYGFQPVDWKEKETMKEQYTGGKEYFLFSGDLHPRNNLVNLLKAFSFFKTRQKSNMQLVITSGGLASNDLFLRNFKTYKFRKEVILLLDQPEAVITKITAAAYAFVYPSFYDGPGIFPSLAMQCGVPVITGNKGAFSLTATDTLLETDPASFEDIAYKMMLLFKDENRRSEIISQANAYLQQKKMEPVPALW